VISNELEEYANQIQNIHGHALLSEVADGLPRESVATCHFMMALSHLELAAQNFKMAAQTGPSET